MTQRRFTTKDSLGNVYYLVVGQHVILTGPSRIPLSLSYAAIRDEAALTFALEDIRDSNDTKANTTQRMLEAVRKYCSNPKLEWTEFFP